MPKMSQSSNLIDLSAKNVEREIKNDSVRCQRCLEHGHWTYECTGERKYVSRESRSAILQRKLRQAERFGLADDAKSSKGVSDEATQNEMAKTPNKLQILAEATALELETLVEREKYEKSKTKIGPENIFGKSTKLEVLKQQLQKASKRKVSNSKSNEKYLEATANLEALVNKDIENITETEKNETDVNGKKGDLLSSEIPKVPETNGCNELILCEKTKQSSNKRSRSSSRSSSFDDTDTSSSSSSSQSDSDSESSDASKKAWKDKHLNSKKKIKPARKQQRKIKSYFNIPSTKIGLILGKGQETIKNISDVSETHCSLYKKTPTDAKESKIIIRGTRHAVKRAKAMIMEVLYVPYEGQYTDYLTIPAKKCGIIIGRGGEVIKDIKNKTGARCDVDMNSWNYGRDKYVIIRGPAECVDLAKDMIIQILEDDKKDTHDDFIIVTSKKLGLIIGKGGETIKNITHSTGVVCELDKNESPEARERKMYLKGKKHAVEKAKQMIMETMYAPKKGEYTDFISVPSDMCGLIIGKKGETIKEINQLSGTLCEVDANVPTDALNKNVIIQGTLEAIDKAKSLIKQKLDIMYPHERLLVSLMNFNLMNRIYDEL